MAKWLEQASQWHEMYCHDLEFTSSNPGRVELGVHSTSVRTSSINTWYNDVAEIVELCSSSNNNLL